MFMFISFSFSYPIRLKIKDITNLERHVCGSDISIAHWDNRKSRWSVKQARKQHTVALLYHQTDSSSLENRALLQWMSVYIDSSGDGTEALVGLGAEF
jgi:hypothetical protein